MNVALGKQSSLIANISKRGLMSKELLMCKSKTCIVMRQSTTDVELNGFKITAVDDDDNNKNLIFLHGLLG